MIQREGSMEAPFTDVPGALAEIRAGRMVVVVDDEDRENEGDLTLAAQYVTPDAINFMARYGRGLICLTLTEERADYLRLFPMTQQNSSRFGTAFTETIEAREGVTTGISAADRAQTIRVAIEPKSTAADLARPGHIFPLRARRGGVLVRAGQTEASVDLARMAGLDPSGVICEIMRDDGEMARIPDLIPFCQEHGLRILTVAELIRYRLRNERYIVRAGESRIQTRYGEFRMIAYESEVNGGESHIALVRGDLCPGCPAFMDGPSGLPGSSNARPPCPHAVLVRVHTRCTAGDIFGADCHCREILDQSMRMIAEEGLRRDSLSAQHIARIRHRSHPGRCFSTGRRGDSSGRERGRHRAPDSPQGTAPARGLAGPIGAHSSRHRPGRPDPVGPGHPAHPVVIEHAYAYPRARGLRPGDSGTGSHPGRRVHPGGVRRLFFSVIRDWGK